MDNPFLRLISKPIAEKNQFPEYNDHLISSNIKVKTNDREKRNLKNKNTISNKNPKIPLHKPEKDNNSSNPKSRIKSNKDSPRSNKTFDKDSIPKIKTENHSKSSELDNILKTSPNVSSSLTNNSTTKRKNTRHNKKTKKSTKNLKINSTKNEDDLIDDQKQLTIDSFFNSFSSTSSILLEESRRNKAREESEMKLEKDREKTKQENVKVISIGMKQSAKKIGGEKSINKEIEQEEEDEFYNDLSDFFSESLFEELIQIKMDDSNEREETYKKNIPPFNKNDSVKEEKSEEEEKQEDSFSNSDDSEDFLNDINVLNYLKSIQYPILLPESNENSFISTTTSAASYDYFSESGSNISETDLANKLPISTPFSETVVNSSSAITKTTLKSSPKQNILDITKDIAENFSNSISSDLSYPIEKGDMTKDRNTTCLEKENKEDKEEEEEEDDNMDEDTYKPQDDHSNSSSSDDDFNDDKEYEKGDPKEKYDIKPKGTNQHSGVTKEEPDFIDLKRIIKINNPPQKNSIPITNIYTFQQVPNKKEPIFIEKEPVKSNEEEDSEEESEIEEEGTASTASKKFISYFTPSPSKNQKNKKEIKDRTIKAVKRTMKSLPIEENQPIGSLASPIALEYFVKMNDTLGQMALTLNHQLPQGQLDQQLILKDIHDQLRELIQLEREQHHQMDRWLELEQMRVQQAKRQQKQFDQFLKLEQERAQRQQQQFDQLLKLEQERAQRQKEQLDQLMKLVQK